MAGSKESQRVEQQLTELQNASARTEAKLDALMAATMKKEDIEKIQLPEKKEIKPISSAPPYTIKEEPISTTEVPVTPVSEVVDTSQVQMEHKDTITPPVTPVVPAVEPSEGYDKLTEGEAIKLVKGITDPVEQSKYSEYEKANKNRERVLEAIATVPAATPPPSPTSSTGKVS